MCKCGCNTCETEIRGPLLTEGKIKGLISNNLQYHIDKNIPLMENVFRIGSDAHLSMIKEARKLYTRNALDLCEDDKALMETHIGEFDLFENEIVPLDLPMLNEVEIGDRVKIDKTYGGGEGEVKDKIGSFVVVNDKSYHESDVDKILDEKLKGLDGKACWKGYKLSGTKKKGGKTVDNCVPMEEDIATKDEVLDLIARKNFDKDFKDLSEVEADFVKGEAKKRNLDEEDMDINELMEMEIIDENITEAKYQGKTVDLNKPTRGDSKKFKVYVNTGKKNADGSIKVKKVNFGHGGTTAKKAGQKTMSIRKSNPKARSAFRARHNCSSPGPKTMARYWSCKKW